MNCDKCGDAIEVGEEGELHGQTLCDDCYMDALSPARACDPWAVHSAKSFMKQPIKGPGVNPTQAKILEILQESGGLEAKILVEKLQIKPSDLGRELASLRHMEKVRGELRDGKKIVRLW
jgi:hypothetical protein